MNYTAHMSDERAQNEKSRILADLPLNQHNLRTIGQSRRFDLSYERHLLLVVTPPVERQWKCLLEMMHSQDPELCKNTVAALEQGCGIASLSEESEEGD